MARAAPFQSDYAAEVAEFEASLRREERVADTFAFDPNKADSATFVRLGLPSYIAQRIVRFRTKNGVFRTADDFFKIYGLTEEKYGHLKPFVQIADVRKRAKPYLAKGEKKELRESEPAERLNLNRADTADLKRLHGVGSKLAARIVKFRDLVGGFHSKEQLKEVYGLAAESYHQIAEFVFVEDGEAKRFTREDVLKRNFYHPYLNKGKLKIVRMMLQRQETLSVAELRDSGEFDAEELKRLVWYFDFVRAS
jgi:competence ComEA-like helix-hairpin-helix protein